MFLENVEKLREYAATFARGLAPGACVALHGDLGAGKTEFARAVIRALRGEGAVVPSPTFTIAQEYGGISHFDLYRVKGAEELLEIGLPDALGRDIVLIEWPEIAWDILPGNTIHVYLEAKGRGREITVK